MSLRDRLAAEIRAEGPIGVDRYVRLCLDDPEDGYYAARPRLGADGDFITAPHVSQMFGELLGAWAAEVWARLGRPAGVRLVEIGPGDGTMFSDVFRVAGRAKGFLAACEIWLVEPSAPLQARQRVALAHIPGVRWVSRFADVPRDLPIISLCNEALDCLPIRQAVWASAGWRERRIGLDAGGALAFTLGGAVEPPWVPRAPSLGDVVEWSPELAALGREVGAILASAGGAALFVDYGRAGPEAGDTLQAIRDHERRHPLADPGAADLTAHVDFPAFLAAARSAGAAVTAVGSQAGFLRALGIEARADALARATPAKADLILRQLRRLIAPDQMGLAFKVACVHASGLEIPGLEAGR